MKKISLFIILGIVIGSILTYFILDSKESATQEASKVLNSPEIENLKRTLMRKEQKIQNLLTQKIDLENKNLELLKITKKELLSFSNDELGFSFSYPAWLGKLEFFIGPGNTGKGFYGSFENVPLAFGGLTKDHTTDGSDPWATDYRGELLEEMYYGYEEKNIKTLSVKGGEVMLLQGKGELMPGNLLPEGTFGALVKLNGKEFHGLAFQSGQTHDHQKDHIKISLDEFESILKTLVIK